MIRTVDSEACVKQRKKLVYRVCGEAEAAAVENCTREAIMARNLYQRCSEPSFMTGEALRLTQIARL